MTITRDMLDDCDAWLAQRGINGKALDDTAYHRQFEQWRAECAAVPMDVEAFHAWLRNSDIDPFDIPAELYAENERAWRAEVVAGRLPRPQASDAEEGQVDAELAARGDEITIKAEFDGSLFLACASGKEISLAAAAGESTPPTFDMIAYTGKPMRPRGWTGAEPIVFDIASMTFAEGIIVNESHGPAIGHVTEMHAHLTHLQAKGVLSVFDPSDNDDEAKAARAIIGQAAEGSKHLASIEARIKRSNIELLEGDTVVVNGQQFAGPVALARKARMVGVAIMALDRPAADDRTATIIETASAT
jgi:hypothetical protein